MKSKNIVLGILCLTAFAGFIGQAQALQLPPPPPGYDAACVTQYQECVFLNELQCSQQELLNPPSLDPLDPKFDDCVEKADQECQEQFKKCQVKSWFSHPVFNNLDE